MPDVSGVTVVTMLVWFYFFPREAAARRAPGIPCALCDFGRNIHASLGRPAVARMRRCAWTVRSRGGLSDFVIARANATKHFPPSCPALCRVSTFFLSLTVGKDVDGRDEPGHDAGGDSAFRSFVSSLRGVKRRSNPAFLPVPRWIASLALAMTAWQSGRRCCYPSFREAVGRVARSAGWGPDNPQPRRLAESDGRRDRAQDAGIVALFAMTISRGQAPRSLVVQPTHVAWHHPPLLLWNAVMTTAS